MSFLYPRAVSFARPNASPAADVGDQGYEAQRGAVDEQPIAGLTNLDASIQLDRQGQANPTQLPTDVRQVIYRIFIPNAEADLGQITEGDICTDELGKRYVVFAAYWDSMGYAIRGTLLEV